MGYFKGIFILVMLFGIILSGNACNRILSDNWTMDSRFKGDIIRAPSGWEFRFRPDKILVKGKTTEQEIYAIYPHGPSMRFTYLKPYWKVIHDRSFMVDRILGFNYYRSEPVKRENYTGYVGVEAMMYYIFLYKGTVQDYSIKHKIAGRNKKGDWETGPYDTGDLALDSVSLWPGSIQDTSRYYRQRTESDLRRINEHKISDFKEEDRFIAEMEKRFGKMSDEDRQEVYDITGKPEKELFNMIASGASYDDIMKEVKKAQPAYY